MSIIDEIESALGLGRTQPKNRALVQKITEQMEPVFKGANTAGNFADQNILGITPFIIAHQPSETSR